jgi:5-carboxymethyl-2-hydroxymuconate isomerase
MKIVLNEEMYLAQRIFCIGRNYVEHVQELSNKIPDSPVIFIKPPTCLAKNNSYIRFPPHGKDLHHEAELVILIGKDGQPANKEQVNNYIAGLSLGLDLTLRDVQAELKRRGLPWEKAKTFEQSAPIGEFVPYKNSIDLTDIHFSCSVNGKIRQKGHSAKMIFPVNSLILELGKIWHLRKGDLIYTGTPSGVGRIEVGDIIEISSELIGVFRWEIVDQN